MQRISHYLVLAPAGCLTWYPAKSGSGRIPRNWIQ